MTGSSIHTISKLDPKLFEDFKSEILSLVDRVTAKFGFQPQIPLQVRLKSDNRKIPDLPTKPPSPDLNMHRYLGKWGIWESCHYLGPERKEDEFVDIWEEVQGTSIEEVLKNAFPVPVCRSRVMILDAEKRSLNPLGYPVHTDNANRFHIPLITNENCGFIFPKQNLYKQMAADGTIYWVETLVDHSFVNWNGTSRIHVMFSTLDGGWNPNL